MASTKYITQSGRIKDLTIKGSGTLKSIGCVVKLPKPTDVLELPGTVCISNCNEPLQIRQGVVLIDGKLVTKKTWGDGVKHHENSELFIQKYEVEDPIDRHLPKRGQKQPEYHVDRFLQAYSLSGYASVGNVTIKELYGRFRNPSDQAFILSEAADFYHDFDIGSEVIDVEMEYGYFLRATNGTRISIGGGETHLTSLGGIQPAIHIADKFNPIKPTPYESKEITIASSLQSTRNVIPFYENTLLRERAEELGMSYEHLRLILT